MSSNKRQKLSSNSTVMVASTASAASAPPLAPSAVATKVMQITHIRELLQTYADYPENNSFPDRFYLRGGWKFAHLSVSHCC